jgi:hypothetical protein
MQSHHPAPKSRQAAAAVGKSDALVGVADGHDSMSKQGLTESTSIGEL